MPFHPLAASNLFWEQQNDFYLRRLSGFLMTSLVELPFSRRRGANEISVVYIALFVRRFWCSRSEFLETRIIPERIEHRIEPEQRRGKRHGGTEFATNVSSVGNLTTERKSHVGRNLTSTRLLWIKISVSLSDPTGAAVRFPGNNAYFVR